jgi:hypothetical protein
VSVFDYGDPASPRGVSRIEGRYREDATFAGGLALLAGEERALQYYDLSDPAAPVPVGELHAEDYAGWSLAVAAADRGLVLLAQRIPGWRLIPRPPPTPEGPPTPGPSPTRTPAATQPPDGGRLLVVDGSNPRSPEVLGSVIDPVPFGAVAYHRTRAYVGLLGGGWANGNWHVYDVLRPDQPQRLTTLIDGASRSLPMSDAVGAGELLYVAAVDEGAYILQPMGNDAPTVTSTPTPRGPASATPTFVTWTPSPESTSWLQTVGPPTETPTPGTAGPQTETPTATTTARGPGTLPPPFHTATAEAAGTLTASASEVPICRQLFVPVAEAGR